MKTGIPLLMFLNVDASEDFTTSHLTTVRASATLTHNFMDDATIALSFLASSQ